MCCTHPLSCLWPLNLLENVHKCNISVACYLRSFVEESNADKAIKALTAALAPKARVKRDGKVSTVEAKELVPGDIIIIQFGNIVPADIKLLGKENDNTETPMQVISASVDHLDL